MSDQSDRENAKDMSESSSLQTADSLTHLSEIALNSFLDGETTPEETALVVEHLRSCTSCNEALNELRGLTLLLGTLPAPAMRRSYQLSPELAKSGSSLWERLSSLLLPALPALRAATVAVTLLFVAVTIRNSVSETGVTSENAVAIPTVALSSTALPTSEADTGRNSAQVESNQVSVTIETTSVNSDALEIGAAAPADVVSEESSETQSDDSALSQSEPADGNSTTSDNSASSSSAFSSEPAAPVTEAAPAEKAAGGGSTDSEVAGDEDSAASDAGEANASASSTESEISEAGLTGGGETENSTFGESAPTSQEASTEPAEIFKTTGSTNVATPEAPSATGTSQSTATLDSPIASPVVETTLPSVEQDQSSIWNAVQLVLGVATAGLALLLFALHIRQRRYSK